MPHPPTQFKLKIQDVEQTALFELSWTNGLPIDARVTIPSHLFGQYQTWRDRYYDFYRTAQIPLQIPSKKGTSVTPTGEQPDPALRGRKAGSAKLTIQPKDSRKKLVKAELDLIYSFNLWLRSPELYEIRDRLAQASREVSSSPNNLVIELFLTFTSSKLLRLPWEAWEIGSEFAPIGNIRIAHAPANIHQPLSAAAFSPRQSLSRQSPSRQSPSRQFLAHQRSPSRRQPRMLVILGDDTGLDLTTDLDSIHTLKRTAHIKTVGWTAKKTIDELSNEIMDAIADPRGWDVLFFAGHSHEMKIGGGELAIAPKTTIALKELKPSLVAAQRHGLTFALFNSCSGLDIAAQLIDWGLSQVAVMREPIHNQVAQTFLDQFLQGLADHQDVHKALLNATDFFKSKTNIAYPSAHLIPTLFRHPQSTLYEIPKKDWTEWLQRLLPTRYEAIALGVLAAISLVPSVQERLLEQRTLTQAQYRQMTGRVEQRSEPKTASVPIVLVQIDGDSFSKDAVSQRYPISQAYMARIIRQLTNYQPTIIGIDYVFDDPQDGEVSALANAIEDAIAQGIQIVFGSYPERGTWRTVSPDIAPQESPQRVHGDIRAWPNRVMLPHWFREQPKPFAYALAQMKNPLVLSNGRTQRSIPTILSYKLGQQWFEPIIDFSIPPEQIYQSIPAWTLNDAGQQSTVASQLKNIDQQVVLIVAGGYPEAGIEPGEDNKPAPLAIQYWNDKTQGYQVGPAIITGGELQAYRLHHFLTQRLVIPLPDIVFVLIAAILGKGVVLGWNRFQQTQSSSPTPWRWIGWGVAGTIFYSVVSLESYLSPVAILIPIALPLLMFWAYLLPPIRNALRYGNRF